MIKKILKFFYFLFFVFLAIVALFLIFSILPVSKGAYQTLIVHSGSMEPAIRTGSIVIVKSVGDYQVGDIITFGGNSEKKKSTTHRIMEIKEGESGKEFVTKGDANNAPDQRVIEEDEIIGKVLFSVPFAGYIVNAAKQPLGFVLIIIIPAAIIIYDESRSIGKEIKKMREKKKEKRPEPEDEKKIPPRPRKII